MMNDIELIGLSVQGKRLLREWQEINALCENNPRIACIVRKRNHEGLPVVYEIIYKLKTIVGVEDPAPIEVETENGKETLGLRKPIYGQVHRMRITLPNNFPSANGNPQIFFITDIWHPNVRSAGKFKGRVCTNEKELGVTTSLANRIYRIGKYLQYEFYHAEDTKPYPEDTVVAEWVRTEAEPMKWINKNEGIQCDYSNLKEKSAKNEDADQKRFIVKPIEDEIPTNKSMDDRIPDEVETRNKVNHIDRVGKEVDESTDHKNKAERPKITISKIDGASPTQTPGRKSIKI